MPLRVYKSVNYDRLGECSPEKDCKCDDIDWRCGNLSGSHLTLLMMITCLSNTS